MTRGTTKATKLHMRAEKSPIQCALAYISNEYNVLFDNHFTIEFMFSLWESNSAVKSWRNIGVMPETQNAHSDDTICLEFKNCFYFQFPEYYYICIIVAIILWHIYSNIYIAGVPRICACICLPISGMTKTFLFHVKRHLKLQKKYRDVFLWIIQ